MPIDSGGADERLLHALDRLDGFEPEDNCYSGVGVE
jgi:hypothetical protein